uniref:Uncharacterized protein n=1 Tax=Arundo donax TaxID=35708 RepID=A0A0A9BFD8_ARUDO
MLGLPNRLTFMYQVASFKLKLLQ